MENAYNGMVVASNWIWGLQVIHGYIHMVSQVLKIFKQCNWKLLLILRSETGSGFQFLKNFQGSLHSSSPSLTLVRQEPSIFPQQQRDPQDSSTPPKLGTTDP